jgi:hypothetical protein
MTPSRAACYVRAREFASTGRLSTMSSAAPPLLLQCAPRGEERHLYRVFGALHVAEDPVTVQLQLASVGIRERAGRVMVARTGTDQSAVVHGPSLASKLTPIATPPLLEIRRRVSRTGGVRTRDRQIRVLTEDQCTISAERWRPLALMTHIAMPPIGARSVSPVASRTSHTGRPQAAYR